MPKMKIVLRIKFEMQNPSKKRKNGRKLSQVENGGIEEQG